LTYIIHGFDQKEVSGNLFGSTIGLISRMRWQYYTRSQKKKFLSYYLFKTYGPPTHKFFKKYKTDLPVEQSNPSKYSVAKRDSHGHATDKGTEHKVDAKPAHWWM